MPYFILDNQFNVIPVDSKGEWEDFVQYEYPSLCQNLPIHEQKDVVIYITFGGMNRYNLFQIIISDGFGNLIDWSREDLNTYDDALELFDSIVKKRLVA